MKNIVNKSKLVVPAVTAVMATVAMPMSAYAATAKGNTLNAGNLLNSIVPVWGNFSLQSAIQVILNSVLAIVLLIALVMLIIGGIRYTTSQGSPDAVKNAKNQIMYALIGVFIVVLSFAIVTFIFNALPQ